jgi:hypothetical protein
MSRVYVGSTAIEKSYDNLVDSKLPSRNSKYVTETDPCDSTIIVGDDSSNMRMTSNSPIDFEWHQGVPQQDNIEKAEESKKKLVELTDKYIQLQKQLYCDLTVDSFNGA